MSRAGVEPTTFGFGVVRYIVFPVFYVIPCREFAQDVHGDTCPLVSTIGVKRWCQTSELSYRKHIDWQTHEKTG